MQDEINEKTVALYIKTGKLTAEVLQKAIKKLLSQAKKELDRQAIPHGKQTLKQLMKQNTGVSNIEITKDNIKAFESTAKKYGIDFALKKDATETPPRYLVFFKGRDADALTAAFKEFSAKKLTQDKKPSIRKAFPTHGRFLGAFTPTAPTITDRQRSPDRKGKFLRTRRLWKSI
ncbi:PcfB family protein [Flintibacter muris]|uniref:PcfB family protein n=1 Tax=Flintibacter muris TaxID=2941327 RepID=UPI00203F0DEC|nr:PcfB family protein [Flintibacter muris]